MKNIGLKFLMITIFCDCSTSALKPNPASCGMRQPSSKTEVIHSAQLLTMKPVDVVKLLKNECCDGILIEQTQIGGVWGEKEATELQAYLSDENRSAPSVSLNSSIMCNGEKYVSTVAREAKHLIKAIEIGRYPLANCSTYDLHLDP